MADMNELSGEFQTGHGHIRAAMSRFDVARAVYVVAYCEDPDCPVREFDVKLKHVEEIEQIRALACPWCGSLRVTIHGAETSSERKARLDVEARELVNAQMWRRDNVPDGELAAMTIAQLTDDRLPPTPPGWWEKR